MKKDAIYQAHLAHPEWHGAEIARQLGVSQAHVSKVARNLNLKLPMGMKVRRDSARIVMKLGWAAIRAGLSIEDIERQAKRVVA